MRLSVHRSLVVHLQITLQASHLPLATATHPNISTLTEALHGLPCVGRYGVPPQSYGAPAPAPYGAPAGPYGGAAPYQVPAPGGYGYGGAPAPAPYGAPPGAPYMVPPQASPQPAYRVPPGGIPVIPGAPPPAAYSAPPAPVKVEPAKPVIYVPDDQSVGTPTVSVKMLVHDRDVSCSGRRFELLECD